MTDATASERCERVRSAALEAGFSRVGFARAEALGEEGARLSEWLARGYHGEMGYMASAPERRADPTAARPFARSVIALALDYHTDHPLSTEVPDDPGRGWISRYAWGRDYHYVADKRLKVLVRRLNEDPLTTGRHHYYVDTGPVLEKALARRAGLGWLGKSTMLIHPRAGSWFFLAVVLTDLDLAPDTPIADHCGSCTRCLDACPTQAFPEPYVLDASRCISYLTIERKGDIPDDLREGVGRHVFGCDICQDVCPWNRKAEPVDEPDFEPRPGLFHPNLKDLLSLDDQAFRDRFTRSPLKRPKHEGLRRNASNAMRRTGEPPDDGK